MSEYKNTQEEANKYLASIYDENMANPNRVNNMMKPTYVSVDVDKQVGIVEFPVLDWELNRVGILHGGIIFTMLDHAVGLTVSSLTGVWGPTIDLNISFLNQGKADSTVVAKTIVTKLGKRIAFVQGMLYEKDTERLIATCNGTYVNNRESK